MKHPIIPPSWCQQAAVPQRKAAHFEQYHHFIPPHPPPAPYPVLEWRAVVALQRSSHSAAFVSADKAAQWAANSFFIVTRVLAYRQKGKVICSNVPSWYVQYVFLLSLFIQWSLKCNKAATKIHQLFFFIRYIVQLLLISHCPCANRVGATSCSHVVENICCIKLGRKWI